MSSTFTAYFRAEVLGEAEALNKMHNLDREIRNLNNRKIQIQTALDLKQADIDKVNSVLKRLEADRMHMIKMGLDTKGIDQQIDGYREAVKRLTSERLEIKGDFDTVVAKLREVKSEADQVKAALDAQWKLHVDLTEGSSAMQAFKKSIDDIISSEDSLEKRTATIDALIKELTAKKSEIKLEHGDLTEVERKLEILKAARDVLTAEDAKIKLDAIDVEKATEKVEELNEEIEEPKKVEVDTSQAVANVRTLGDVAKDVGGFISAIGSSLESIGGMFGGDLLSQVSSSLIAFGSGVVSQGFSNSVSRFDILKTYPAYMRAVGATDEQIETAYTQLNESVLGLPTRLDEIVDSAKQYSLMLGDIDKGTDLAISLNNALIAGGMSEAMQTQSRHELVRLLMIGDLARKNQWFSMLTGFGASAQYIAKELGFEGKNSIQQLASALSAEVSDEATDEEKAAAKAHAKELKAQFIDALITAGQGEEVLALTEVYKDTMGSALKNLRTAFSNLGSSVLEELDTVLEEETGRDLDDTIVAVSDTIKQRLIPAVRDFVQEHPDFIMNMVDKLTSYDWGTLLSNVGNGLLKYAEVMSTLLSSIPPEVISFFMVGATPIGRALSGLGSFLQMLGGLKLPSFLTKGKGLANAGGQIASFGQSIASVFVGAVGTALTIGNIYLIGQVIKEFANIAADIGAMDFGNASANLEQIAPVIGYAFAAVAAITGGIATAHLTTGGVSSAAIVIGELLASGLIGLVAEVGWAMGEVAEAVNSIGEAEIPTSTKIKNFGDAIKAIIENFDIDPGEAANIASNHVAFSNMAGIVDDIVDIGLNIEKLDAIDISNSEIPKLGERARQIVKATGVILTELKDQFGNNNAFGVATEGSTSGNMTTILGNMKMSIDTIGGIADSIKNMSGVLEGLTEDFTGGQADTVLENFSERIDLMITAVGDIFDKIWAQFDPQKGKDLVKSYGSLGWSKKTSGQMDTILTNMSGAITSLGDIATQVDGMTSQMTNLMNDYTGEGSRFDIFKERLTGEGGFIESIGDIFNSINKAFGIEGAEYSDFTDSLTKSVEITGILDNIKTAIGTIKGISDAITDTTWILGQVTSSNEATEGMTPAAFIKNKAEMMLKQLNELFVWMEDAQNLSDISVTSGVGDKLEAIAGENGAIAKMADISQRLFDMKDSVAELVGGEGDTFELGGQLRRVFNALKAAFKVLDSEAFDTSNLPDQVTNLQEAIKTTGEIMLKLDGMSGMLSGMVGENGFEEATQLQTFFSSLMTAFSEIGGDSGVIAEAAKAMSDLADSSDKANEKLGEVKQTAQEAGENISLLNTRAGNAVTGMSNLTAAASSAASMMRSAAASARALASAINSIPNEKTVRVNVSQSGSSVKSVLSNVRSRFADGGAVQYRALGGGFAARGTDIIPAMLTPGEYVHRRAAVKAFGEEFMSRINNLDLTGALQALSLRAGSGIIPRQIPTVNNTYNRDNHARLTQNIYSNNPNYSMKRASRWMRSL